MKIKNLWHRLTCRFTCVDLPVTRDLGDLEADLSALVDRDPASNPYELIPGAEIDDLLIQGAVVRTLQELRESRDYVEFYYDQARHLEGLNPQVVEHMLNAVALLRWSMDHLADAARATLAVLPEADEIRDQDAA